MITTLPRKLMIARWRKSVLAVVLLLLSWSTTAPAQILYSQLVSINPDPSVFPRYRFQLRQVNGNGTGDTAFGLPFASATFPTWSRDAALFAISAQDPNRPNDRSHNIYAVNAANGAIQQITLNQSNPPDPQTGAFQFAVPQYTAFSPNRGAIAVSSVIVSSNGQVGQTGTTPTGADTEVSRFGQDFYRSDWAPAGPRHCARDRPFLTRRWQTDRSNSGNLRPERRPHRHERQLAQRPGSRDRRLHRPARE